MILKQFQMLSPLESPISNIGHLRCMCCVSSVLYLPFRAPPPVHQLGTVNMSKRVPCFTVDTDLCGNQS
ncbi:hypothetical protein DL89DRAFT_264903 [Linderina pennispora]|uniref:Uncharacterized protein n=1 Tax=Linderina pennispora TaxID=61395 RepID=A0A1Y1WH85_9FUNG|nr:uncharacterized protein DL89DRAFT_264903 [Linderina pennispora]ORX72698.1 hypothetical protein DL89DRAFT_264903 [Linderina pennispora]